MESRCSDSSYKNNDLLFARIFYGLRGDATQQTMRDREVFPILRERVEPRSLSLGMCRQGNSECGR